MTKAVAITYTPGPDFLKSIKATNFEIDVDSIGPEQIAIRALSNPINPSDVSQLKGAYTAPKKQTLGTEQYNIGGNEGLFEVIKVGTNVGSILKGTGQEFAPGDWVVTTLPGFGTWRLHVVVDVAKDAPVAPLIRIKTKGDLITLEQAATIGVNPPTALQLFENYKTFEKGKDWIIQNAGASQVSKFLAQFAKANGVNVISVVRGNRSNQKEINEQLLSLGVTKVITEEESQSEKFQKEIVPKWVSETGGELKLAINAVGGKLASALVHHLSTGGVLVTYGQLDPEPIQYQAWLQLSKDITTTSYWYSRNTIKDPKLKVKTLAEVVDYYGNGTLEAVPFEGIEVKVGTSDFQEIFTKAIENSSKDKQVVLYKW